MDMAQTRRFHESGINDQGSTGGKRGRGASEIVVASSVAVGIAEFSFFDADSGRAILMSWLAADVSTHQSNVSRAGS
jgi:hypothetical protein